MTGNVKKFIKNKGYESINRSMLQDEDNLSLEAIGLLANLTSYPDGWELHKTELYKRFAKSKRTKVERAWNELVDQSYIVQLRKRTGKKYDYFYFHSTERFSDEEILQLAEQEQAEIWDGKVSNQNKETKPLNNSVSSTVENQQSNIQDSSTVDFQQSKLNSRKSTDNKLTTNILTTKTKLDTIDTENLVKEKMKNEILEDAYKNNTEKIPHRLADIIHILTSDENEADTHYKIIVQAKLKIENELDFPLFFEEDDELLQVVIQSYANAVRKIEKGSVGIENKEGYIFTAIYNSIQKLNQKRIFPQEKMLQNTNTVLYNWLNEKTN